MVRWLLSALVAPLTLIGSAASAPAAELRITFDELTRLVQSIAAGAKVYLNNAPGMLFSTQSYIAITSSQQYPLTIPVKSFDFFGSTYVYYINDITSTSLRILPVNGALRLSMMFETDGPEAVAGCISGDCLYTSVLPDIEWNGLGVSIDFVPIQFQDSISLQAKSVSVSGQPRAVCKPSAGTLARATCTLGLPFANSISSRLKADLPKILKEQINKSDVQQQFADGLRKSLTIGQAGAVAISAISIAPKGMTVDFRFNAASAN